MKKSKARSLTLFTLFTAYLFALEANAERFLYVRNSLIVGSKYELNQLFRVDLNQLCYESFYAVPNGYQLHTPEASPNGELIAIPFHAAQPIDRAFIDLVNAAGEFVTRIDGALDPAWNSDGTQLAYVSVEVQLSDVVVTGVWIYDIELKAARKLYDRGYTIEWAHFNDNIYINPYEDGGNLIELDPDTGKVTQTELGTGNFSIGGTYYFASKEERPYFLRETLTPVAGAYDFLQTPPGRGYPDWLSDTLTAIFQGGKKNHTYLFSFTTGRTYRAPGRILALSDDHTSIYISRSPDGNIERLPIETLELVHLGRTAEEVQTHIERLKAEQKSLKQTPTAKTN